MHQPILFCVIVLLSQAAAQAVIDIPVTITSNVPFPAFDINAMAEFQNIQIANISYGTSGQCPAGYYCPSSTDIIACPVNTFNANMGATTSGQCISCPSYTVTAMAGYTSCSVCAAGQQLRTPTVGADPSTDIGRMCVDSPAGGYSPSNSTSAYECSIGQFSPQGSPTCLPCSPGSYSGATQATSCTPCSAGYSTFSVTYGSGGVPSFHAIAGSTSVVACKLVPIDINLCQPGTYFRDQRCLSCPVGYFCPGISSQNTDQSVQICPNGHTSTTTGAASYLDCMTSHAPASIQYGYITCPLTASPVTALTDLSGIVAITAPRNSDQSVILATTTAVYRLMTTTSPMHLELLAGVDGVAGNTLGAYGQVRFSGISAVATDVDGNIAHMLVIGDKITHRVVFMDLYSRQTKLIGTVITPGGIALQAPAGSGMRYAFVSDTTKHCLWVFNMDNYESRIVAGSPAGMSGYQDGSTYSKMWEPMGIAFLEDSISQNVHLLIADSKNRVIRQYDASSGAMSTWFAPQDRSAPEMVNPVSVSVAVSPGKYIVYVIDTGFSPYRLSAITLVNGVHVLTVLETSQVTSIGATGMLIPGPQLLTNSNGGMSVRELIYLKSDNGLSSLLTTDLAQTSVSTSTGSCVFPTQASGVAAVNLCGNLFIDGDEQCDTGDKTDLGCNMATCTFMPTYTCLGGATQCLVPCQGYLHIDGFYHCAPDCLQLTAATGFHINGSCAVVDINECDITAPTHTCSEYGTCTNTPGSYTCACAPGLFGDGRKCVMQSYEVYTVVQIQELQYIRFQVKTPPLPNFFVGLMPNFWLVLF